MPHKSPIILSPSPDAIARAAEALNSGELVGMPTETVYGLAARADNPEAVARVFAAKGRPADHPLIVHLAHADSVQHWASRIPEAAQRLMAAHWPGPLTLILQRPAEVPAAITGGQDTIAVRVPGHPVARSLIEAAGGALVAPSANRYGRISPTRAEHVVEELGDRVSLVLDGGPCERGIESTIVDVSSDTPRILRPGLIGLAELRATLTDLVDQADKASPRVSGSCESHYAPGKPAQLLAADDIDVVLARSEAAGVTTAVLGCSEHPFATQYLWQLGASAERYAHELYAALRDADASPASKILIERPPDTQEWAGIRDRLTRACAQP